MSDLPSNSVPHSHEEQSSALRSAEARLEISDQRLQMAITAGNVGLWEWDSITDAVWYSPEWKRQLGYLDVEIPNRLEEWKDRLHPDDHDHALARVKAFLESPIGLYESEFRLRHKNSSYRWILAQASVELDAEGRTTRMLGSHVDITERRRVADTITLRDRAIEAVSQGIIITDPNLPDHPIIYASNGFERMTGYRTDEVIGRNCRFLQGHDTDTATVETLRQAIRAGKECSVELLNYRKDGTAFWNALCVSHVRDDAGRLAYFVGVQTDVTARRTLEHALRQSQKMEAVGQLAGGVAHDFNNLLTIITGYSEILLSALGSDHPERGSVRAISEAGDRAASLTRQLLAFSRQTVLEPKILDINEVVREIEKLLSRLLGEDICLTAELEPDLSRVRVDPGQLGQVLMNLAVNSRDAMPKGGKLTIATSALVVERDEARRNPEAQPGHYIVLSISDTGGGMSAEVRARIFEPFFTTKGIGSGTGLGLAVVHGIVRQSGGFIEVESEPGCGTAFRVYLPAVEDPAPVPTAAPAGWVHGSETILLVEDEEALRRLAMLILRTYGYTVLVAGDGAEAVCLAENRRGKIDLLVTDVVMPGMDGPELAERLRPLFPEMKVLFSSGYTDDAVVRHGISQEDVAFLGKPYTPVEMAHKVRRVLDSP